MLIKELLMASNFFDTKGTKVVCVGQNYRTHCEEMGSPIPEVPLLFVKPGSALTFASLPLAIPTDVGEIHHEVELAVCINKEMKNITSEKALDFVKGYTVAIDVTAREIQKVEKSKGWPWTLSKCQDGFAPIMETIVPPQKIDVNNTEIWLDLDGKIQQKGNIKDLIFKIPDLLAYISKHITLYPGDIVLTGTPSGVGPMLPGQRVRIGINSSPFSATDSDMYTAEFDIVAR